MSQTKGQMGIEEMYKLFAVIIVGVVIFVVLFSSGTGGGLVDMIKQFKQSNPALFGQTTENVEDKDFRIGAQSTQALVCATNIVAGGDDKCSKDFPVSDDPNNLGASVKCDCKYQKFVYFSNRNLNPVEFAFLPHEDGNSQWKWKLQDETPSWWEEITGTAEYQSDNWENTCENYLGYPTAFADYGTCKSFEKGIGALKTALAAGDEGDKIKVGLTTEPANFVNVQTIDNRSFMLLDGMKPKSCNCDVVNFNLPQTIKDDKLLYIVDHGDPKMLVYWQNFPAEQDTWSFQADWKFRALVIGITMVPWSKVGGTVGKLGWASFKTVAAEGAEKLVAKELGKDALKKIQLELIEKFSKTAKNTMSNDAFEKIALNYATKKALRSMAMKELANMAKVRWVAFGKRAAIAYGVIITADALAESMMDKYTEHPNAIMLKQPYKKEQIFPLDQNGMKLPVYIKWDPGWATSQKTTMLHLVSPCSAKKLEVAQGFMYCKNYQQNFETGAVSCQSSGWLTAEESKDYPPCDSQIYMGIKSEYLDTATIGRTSINDVLSGLRKIDGIEIDQFNITDKAQKIKSGEDSSDEAIPGKWVPLEKSDEKCEPQKIKIKTGERNEFFEIKGDGFVEYNSKYYEKEMILLDSDGDCFYDTWAMPTVQLTKNNEIIKNDWADRMCKTNAIAVNLDTESENMPVGRGEYNYCVDNKGSGSTIASWAGTTVSVGCAIGCWFIPGPGWVAGSLVVATSAAATIADANELYKDVVGNWPGSKG